MGYIIVTQKAIVERPQLGPGDREVERLEAGGDRKIAESHETTWMEREIAYAIDRKSVV